MGRYYQEKQTHGGEYVRAVIEFESYVRSTLIKLPRKWDKYYIDPIVESVTTIGMLIVKANSVYVNKDNQPHDKYIQAIEKRMEDLTEALREFKVFEHQFCLLLSKIDFMQTEKNRLKKILLNKLKELEPNADVKLAFGVNEITYTAGDNQQRIKLGMTVKHKDRILELEADAIELIRKRYTADKKLLKAAEKEIKEEKIA